MRWCASSTPRARLPAACRSGRFDDLLLGLDRDVDWVSVDPLVPLGPDARHTVQRLDAPARVAESHQAACSAATSTCTKGCVRARCSAIPIERGVAGWHSRLGVSMGTDRRRPAWLWAMSSSAPTSRLS